MFNLLRRSRGQIIPANARGPYDDAVELAVEVLDDGGVTAFPTDTVYGLGCRADDARAVKKIYKLKGRDFDKPLILFIDSPEKLAGHVQDLPDYAARLAERYWPGPLTMVFKASPRTLKWGLDREGTIGFRIPAAPVVLEIVKRLDVPLATTSANRSSGRESYNVRQVVESFNSPVDLVLDGGQLPPCKPSTVLDLSRPVPAVLRKGGILRDELSEVLGRPVKLDRAEVLFVCTGNTCRTPMAEGYLRHMLPKEWKDRVIVRSCGTKALPGMPATDKGQEVCKKAGFDTSEHQSRALTDHLLKQADLVIAMEESHRGDILKLFPQAKVSLLAVDGVPDPIGGTTADYQRTLDLIKKEMPDVLEKIKELLA
jgi:tRNA threonylcarbamoyl adenosine modification protein (Sua5/YciO/YrdC/YwlC family)